MLQLFLILQVELEELFPVEQERVGLLSEWVEINEVDPVLVPGDVNIERVYLS
jgi:hypothetical protein